MTLHKYRERVEAAARRRDGEPIYNGSHDHAAILVDRMFHHAEKSVCILTGELNPRVYGLDEVIEQAKLYLVHQNRTLRILLEHADHKVLKDHPFIVAFGHAPNVEIRVIPPRAKQAFEFHFLTMDGDSYRFESDKTQYAAIAAFGDKKGAANLDRVFETIWKVSAPIKLPEVAAA